MMAFVINRVVLAFKNKDNTMTDIVKNSKPSLISVYQETMKKVGGTEKYKELENNLKDYIAQMETYDKIEYKDGVIIQKDIGNARKIGSYNRYLTFDKYKEADFRIFAIMMLGFLQVSGNPFKKKIEYIDLGALVDDVLKEYEPYFMKKLVSLYSLKKNYAQKTTAESIDFDFNAMY